jgi:hypothetical protein
MKKKTIIGLLFIATCITGASETIDNIFKGIPTHLFPHLSESRKLDILDYAKCKMFNQNIETNLEGNLNITEYSDSCITLCINKNYSWKLSYNITERNDTNYVISKTLYSNKDTLLFKNTYDKHWNNVK